MRERIGSQHRRVAVAEAAVGSLGQRAGCEQAVHPAGKNLLVLVIDRRQILVAKQALNGQEPVTAKLVELIRGEATHTELGHPPTLQGGTDCGRADAVTSSDMTHSWDDEFDGLLGALRQLHRRLFERPRGGGSDTGLVDGMGLAEGQAIADADWGSFGDLGGW